MHLLGLKLAVIEFYQINAKHLIHTAATKTFQKLRSRVENHFEFKRHPAQLTAVSHITL